MALTRITRGVIKPNENYDTHNIVSTGIVTSVGLDVNGNADISGSLSVGGVLTYEDVTSIDSVGIITARTGLVSPYADIDDFVSVGNNIHLGNAGVITATSFVGDGSGLIGVASTDNIVTGTAATFNTYPVDINAGMTVAGVSTFASNVYLGDNDKLQIGDSQDLSIYHNGTNSYIEDSNGSAHLNVLSHRFQILNQSGNESMARFYANGAAELYYDNTKRLETTNAGISITGNNVVSGNVVASGHVMLADNLMIRLGTGYDFELRHTGSHNYLNTQNGNIELRHTVGGANEAMLKAIPNGAVMLFHNGTNRLETSSVGVSIPQDLDVDGHTNLDNVNIAGVTTTTGNVNVGGYVVSQGTSGRGGIFGQVEVGYDNTYLTIQPTSGHNDLHLNFDNGSTVQIGHSNGSTLTVNGNIKPKTDSASDLGLTGTRFRAAYVDTYYGDGSNLTGITQTTINNNADNRIITGSGSANTLEAEANFTFSGSKAIMKHGATTTVSDRGLMLQASTSLTNGQVLPGITLNPNTNVDRPRAGIAGIGHGSSNGTAGMHLIFMTAYRDDGSQLTSSDERLRITSDGRVYIGATSGGNGDTDDLIISGSGKKGITICSTDGSETRLTFADGLSGTNAVVGQVMYDHSANRMDFTTSTTRRMSIDTSGRVLIGTLTEGHENADNFTISASGTAGMTIRSTSSNCHIYFSDATSGAGEYVGQIGYNHGSDYMFFHASGSERLRADSSGITVTGTVDSASDVILKENIKTIDNALDKVTKLRGVEYDYKENKKHSIGVIAQEVEEVLPELVNGSEQKSVAYGNIAAVLIEAIKEQNEIINKMKKEIEDLKG